MEIDPGQDCPGITALQAFAMWFGICSVHNVFLNPSVSVLQSQLLLQIIDARKFCAVQ